jgi:hypothetical protein
VKRPDPLRPQVIALRPRLHHTRPPCGVIHWLILHLPAPLVTMRPTPDVQVLHGGNYLSLLQPRHHNVWSRECADLHRCGSCTEYGIYQQERQRSMMNSHAHGITTYTRQLAPAPGLARTRTADVHRELPICPVNVLVWIVLPVTFWGSIALWILAR